VITDDGLTAQVDLTGGTENEPAHATVNFENEMEQYARLSHTSTVTNVVNKSVKITALSVDYHGPSPITDTSLSEYVFTADDLTITALFDDNSEQVIDFTDENLKLDPVKVTGDDNGGKTIVVSYTYDGVTVSDSFNVDIDLNIPIKTHTITFHSLEGTFKGGLTNQITVEWDSANKTSTLKSGTYEVPTYSLGVFAGWYKDEGLELPYTAITDDGLPTEALTEDLDLYAKYVYAIVTFVKSFEERTDKSQYEAKDWLITEYADYANGVNVLESGSEEPTAENMGLADGETFGAWYVYDPETDTITGVLNLKNKLEGNIIAVGSKTKVFVKYAVSVYGIEEDILEDGDRAGLTFGPATGEDYNAKFRSHTPSAELTKNGNEHRCIHNDTWDTIIHWATEDPYVYEECIAQTDANGVSYSCTKSVPLSASSRGKILTDENKSKFADQTNGDGVGTLVYSLAESYTYWNYSQTTTGGWPASRIRATLNGAQEATADGTHNKTNYAAGADMAGLTTAQSLFGTFPAELQSAIQKRKTKSDVVYSDALNNNVTTYDRLWLFAGTELYVTVAGFGADGFDMLGSYPMIREHEGLESGKDSAAYSRQTELGVYDAFGQDKMVIYTEYGPKDKNGVDVKKGFWFRSLYGWDIASAGGTMSAGAQSYQMVNYAYQLGISPGFCLGDRE
jgi:uncharacterized repeat protein (TIGR02543 family)